mmetsp:Transcript_20739/g.51374  ORF Transcript_20739/g.51374 Transcript_20739/m.51374 type:complete len:1412 (-) Transcript_20739:131-4366(-)
MSGLLSAAGSIAAKSLLGQSGAPGRSAAAGVSGHRAAVLPGAWRVGRRAATVLTPRAVIGGRTTPEKPENDDSKANPAAMATATAIATAAPTELAVPDTASAESKTSLEFRAVACSGRETFFEEEYHITLREFAPTAVKVHVESNGVRFRVRVETDAESELILHWGVAEAVHPDTWIMPPAAIMPRGTKALAEVCQTPLINATAAMEGSMASTVIEGDIADAPHAINFVLHDQKYNQWYHSVSGDFFRVLCPAVVEIPEEEPESEPEVPVATAVEQVSQVLESVSEAVLVDSEKSVGANVEVHAAVDKAIADSIASELLVQETEAANEEKAANKTSGIGSLLGTLGSYKRKAPVQKAAPIAATADVMDAVQVEANSNVGAVAQDVTTVKKVEETPEEIPEEIPEEAEAVVDSEVPVVGNQVVLSLTGETGDTGSTGEDSRSSKASDTKRGRRKRVDKTMVAALLLKKAATAGVARTKAIPAKAKQIAVKAIAANAKVASPAEVAVAPPSAPIRATAERAAELPAKQATMVPVKVRAPPIEGPWETTFELSETVFTEAEIVSRVGVIVELMSDQPGAAARIRVETDLPGNLFLHWGVVPRGARADMWTVPAPAMRPEGSKVHGDKAVQTPMLASDGGLAGDFRYTELDMGSAPGGVRFVIKEDGGRERWFDCNGGGDFIVPLPNRAPSSNLLSAPRSGAETAEAANEMESAQMALGGAASVAFGVASTELVDATIAEAIREAAIAMETAKHAREIAEQATAAAQALPENVAANTKARRLIAQANAAAERANSAARSAEAAAIRARAAKDASFDDLSAAAAAAKDRADEVEKMAAETWAGEISEISEGTLQRWRDEMELAVTKEAEQRAAKAEAAVLEMLEQRKAAQEQERADAAVLLVQLRKEAEARDAAELVRAAAAAAAEAAAEAAMTETERAERTERRALEEIERELKEKKAALAAMQTLPVAPTLTGNFSTVAAPSGAGVIIPLVQDAADAPPPPLPGKNISAPTGNGREMLIQGFNWESCRSQPNNGWYRKIQEMAPMLKEYGITTIWLPPPTNSVSKEGYMPRDLYDLNSLYGTKDELRECINSLHVNGIKALGDAVLNHRCAEFQGPDGLWNKYGGKLDWDQRAIVSDDPHFGGKGNRSSGDCFHAAPNIDHSQDFVKRDIAEWMQWMQAEVGYDGWRLDYVRGFSGTHVKTYMEATDVKFAVGEFWDTLSYDYDQPQYNQDEHRQRIVNWIDEAGGSAGAFDVTTKGILHAVFERQEYWRLSDPTGAPPGVMGKWASRAVTFIENHDTGSTQGHWRFPEGFELQGYAYILTHPGTPTIFWDHLFEWNNNNSLHDPICDLMKFRKDQGVHCRSKVKILKAEQSVYAAQIDDSVVMKIGPGQFTPDEGEWEYAMHGDDYCLWRKRR